MTLDDSSPFELCTHYWSDITHHNPPLYEAIAGYNPTSVLTPKHHGDGQHFKGPRNDMNKYIRQVVTSSILRPWLPWPTIFQGQWVPRCPQLLAELQQQSLQAQTSQHLLAELWLGERRAAFRLLDVELGQRRSRFRTLRSQQSFGAQDPRHLAGRAILQAMSVRESRKSSFTST